MSGTSGQPSSETSRQPSSESMFVPRPWTTISGANGAPDRSHIFVSPPVINTLPTGNPPIPITGGGGNTTDTRIVAEDSADHMANGRNRPNDRTMDRKRNRFFRCCCFSFNGPRQHAD